MAAFLCCGFECGVTGSTAHVSRNTSASITTALARTGTRSLRCNPAADIQGNAFTTTLGGATVGVARVYLYISSAPIVNEVIVGFLNGSTHIAGLAYDTVSGQWFPGSDDGTTTTIGSSGVTLATATWHVIDFKVDVSANPWTIDVSTNGVALTQLTRALAATTQTRLYLGNGGVGRTSTYDLYFDDLLVSTAAADYPYGSGKVLAKSPAGDGTHNATPAGVFVRGLDGGANIISTGASPTTDSYLLVDDVPLSSAGASDFITQVTSGAALYVEHTYPATTGTIGPRAVDIIMAGAHLTTAAANQKWKINDNGTTLLVWDRAASGSSGTAYARFQAASMVGGGSWTLARYDALRTRWGYSTDANPDVMMNAIMLEAEFEASAATQAQPITATGIYGVGTLSAALVPHIPISANLSAPVFMWSPL